MSVYHKSIQKELANSFWDYTTENLSHQYHFGCKYNCKNYFYDFNSFWLFLINVAIVPLFRKKLLSFIYLLLGNLS